MSRAVAFDPICAHVIETTTGAGARWSLRHVDTLNRFWSFTAGRSIGMALRSRIWKSQNKSISRVRAGLGIVQRGLQKVGQAEARELVAVSADRARYSRLVCQWCGGPEIDGSCCDFLLLLQSDVDPWRAYGQRVRAGGAA